MEQIEPMDGMEWSLLAATFVAPHENYVSYDTSEPYFEGNEKNLVLHSMNNPEQSVINKSILETLSDEAMGMLKIIISGSDSMFTPKTKNLTPRSLHIFLCKSGYSERKIKKLMAEIKKVLLMIVNDQ